MSLDLSTRYSPHAVPGLKLGIDIYNVLNGSRYQAVQESKEFNYGPNIFYGTPRSASYQQPRALRLSLSYELN